MWSFPCPSEMHLWITRASLLTTPHTQSAPRWQLEPADPHQWKAWATESGLLGSPSAPSTAPETGYIVLDLDGCISGSGPGLPDWPALLAATPTLKLKESAAKKRGA
uniref:Uncharacterized protein n=1 Tax=Auxenochlorella protothecoides TaxID=3075 RepID=A0A1D2AD01_AUXPR